MYIIMMVPMFYGIVKKKKNNNNRHYEWRFSHGARVAWVSFIIIYYFIFIYDIIIISDVNRLTVMINRAEKAGKKRRLVCTHGPPGSWRRRSYTPPPCPSLRNCPVPLPPVEPAYSRRPPQHHHTNNLFHPPTSPIPYLQPLWSNHKYIYMCVCISAHALARVR